MDLKLEPLVSNELMKITPEKEAFFYLLDNGFTEKEIDYIKKCNEKEDIPFCVKTFFNEDLEEAKIELREIMKKNTIKGYIQNFVVQHSNFLNIRLKNH